MDFRGTCNTEQTSYQYPWEVEERCKIVRQILKGCFLNRNDWGDVFFVSVRTQFEFARFLREKKLFSLNLFQNDT